ncbi:MAG: PCYCGC motif-containing (lipo)protein [Gemmatimonadaceae bacterium]
MGVSMAEEYSRRQWLASALFGLVATVSLPRRAYATTRRLSVGPHPTPRPGITAAKIATREQLADTPDAIDVFDQVREIPEIVDGIRCNCGCATVTGYYSLLTCYEGGDAMARRCEICQGQGRLAARMHRSGKSLDEIRKGIDARYG